LADLLAAALDAAATPVFVTTKEGVIAFVNRALLAATGHAAADLVGQKTAALFPEGAANALELARPSLEAGRAYRGESALRRKDGTLYHNDLWVAPIPGAAGEVSHAVATCQDLTERRSQARLLLTDRMVSVGTLAAGVAHEINNPLAFVLTNLTFISDTLGELERGLEGPARADSLRDLGEAVSEVRVGAERVRDIVRDLKIFSRGDDGSRIAVDVQRVLESSVKMAWNEIRHRARLVREFGRDVPPVEAEEARLGQVFLNLVLNAVQAIPEGDAKANEIRVATRTDREGHVVVEIRDTGGGIPNEVRPHLFEPFFTTKPVGVGTGLGLYICREIVLGLGGLIEVESTPGAGACFRVLLPAQGRPAIACGPDPSGEGAAKSPARGRVLVVDDDAMIASTIARILAKHEVILVGSAREALGRLSRGERYDVVLCDLMMPGMSGIDLHAELAKSAPEVLPAMVFLTGGAYTPHASDFVARIANPVIEKPFDPAALRALVAKRVASRPPG